MYIYFVFPFFSFPCRELVEMSKRASYVRIVICICFILTILLLFVFTKFNKYTDVLTSSFFREDFSYPSVLVLTYENTDHAHVPNFIDNLKNYNYEVRRLGFKELWRGFGTKIHAYQSFLRSATTLPDEQIIVICDARDVVINQPAHVFAEKFHDFTKRFPGKIMISTEMGCCTPETDKSLKEKMVIRHRLWQNKLFQKRKNNTFKYLNSGLIAGKKSDLLRVYNKIQVQLDEDDQSKFVQYFFNNKINENDLFLDYEQLFFSNAHFWSGYPVGCFFTRDNKLEPWRNTVTNQIPSFIQTPAKYWDCYRMLQSE